MMELRIVWQRLVENGATCHRCGDAQCRTVKIGSSVYEAIPEALIIRAGLLAAAGLMQDERSSQQL